MKRTEEEKDGDKYLCLVLGCRLGGWPAIKEMGPCLRGASSLKEATSVKGKIMYMTRLIRLQTVASSRKKKLKGGDKRL